MYPETILLPIYIVLAVLIARYVLNESRAFRTSFKGESYDPEDTMTNGAEIAGSILAGLVIAAGVVVAYPIVLFVAAVWAIGALIAYVRSKRLLKTFVDNIKADLAEQDRLHATTSTTRMPTPIDIYRVRYKGKTITKCKNSRTKR